MSKRASRNRRLRPQVALAATGAAWSQLVQMGSEVAVASAHTIAHRTTLMADAAAGAAALDHPEFALMGQEKLDAAVEAGTAMVHGLPAMHGLLAAWAWGQTLRAADAIADASACRSLEALGGVQSRFVETSLAASVETGARLARSSLRIAGTGLRPVHRVASANARRLSSRARAS